ncbi:MAG: L-rhamnose/proton symporter RhaT [bacterium]
MVTANPFAGIALHAIGALSASVCYAPQKKVMKWSWQSYFLTQALFCWLLLPILGAILTIPNLAVVLAEAPRRAMMDSFFLGMAYGIGGMAFNLAIRYIGFSLTYAIAVGLSSVLGTLIPPFVRGVLVETLNKPGAQWVVIGLVVGTIGIALCGLAGRMKEQQLQGQGEFSLAKGLLLSLLAGVLSAVYGFSLDAGQPIAEVALKHGAGVWQGNVIYIFSNSGAFLTTTLFCLWLHIRQKTFGEFFDIRSEGHAGALLLNYMMSILTGMLWYGQFFFYNLGHVRMGTYKFTSWAIHMIMLVLFSNLLGVLLREWNGCRRNTLFAITVALSVLTLAILCLSYGNSLGQ